MTLIKLNSENKKIFFISFLITFTKYLTIYIFSDKTNFSNVVFNNFEDLYYLPYIKYLAELKTVGSDDCKLEKYTKLF